MLFRTELSVSIINISLDFVRHFGF